jgi:hypothetical protein
MAAYRYNFMAERLDDVLTELLAQQSQEGTPSEPAPDTAPTEAAQTEPTAEPVQAPTEPAAAPAEPAAEPAAPAPQAEANPGAELLNRIGSDYERMRQENEQLKDIVAQLKGVIPQFQNALSQQSQAAENTIVEEVIEPPVFDVENVQYLSDDERRAATAKYSSAMADYARKTVLGEVMKEMQPIVDNYKRQTAEAADMTARNRIRSSKGFEDFDDYGDAIDRIAANTPGFDGIDPEMKYALSYMINRGINAMSQKPETETTEMLVERVKNNPDALRALEEMRVKQVAEKNAAVPPVTASQGSATAPAVKPEPPQSLEEATERAYKMLGLRKF